MEGWAFQEIRRLTAVQPTNSQPPGLRRRLLISPSIR